MVVTVPDIVAEALTATGEATVEPGVGELTVTPVVLETLNDTPADFSYWPEEFQD